MFQTLSLFILFVSTSVHSFEYPVVKRNESVVESHFGIEIKDPYRWLENFESEDTKQFMKEQSLVTRKYLDSNPYRTQIKKGITDLINFPKYEIPIKRGSTYYFSQNTGLQNQPIIYSSNSVDTQNPKVFIDVNKLSKDGSTFLSYYVFSPDNKWCAYGTQEGGGDWIQIRIKNVETGIDLNETLTKIKFVEPTWNPDSEGFFYSYFDEHEGKADSTDNAPLNNSKVFYHRVNTSQNMDIMVAKFPQYPLAFLTPKVSDDGKYLYIFLLMGPNAIIWYYSHLNGNPINSSLKVIPVIDKPDATYEYITNDGPITYLLTEKNAPNFRLVAIDVNKPKEENWVNIIRENKKDILKSVIAIYKEYLVVQYIRDVKPALEIRRLSDGHFLKEIPLTIGSIRKLSGHRNDNMMFFSFSTFLTPLIIYSFDFSNKTAAIENLTLNGNNPTLLSAYGGFGQIITPGYDAATAFFINNLNGVFALANIRGGGEYGENWHKDGMLLNKQHCYDDFHAAAQFLINNNYTNRNKLTIFGASNGGLMIGAVSNQRPDLYGCSLASSGIYDMLRFHKFTIGPALIPEYGDPDKEIDFKYLLKYSPLHNVPTNVSQFPAMLITTADHDDRAVPAHSFKFVSQLQYSLGKKLPNTPIMLRIDTNAGHLTGMTITKMIDAITDGISFVMNSLKLKLNANE